MTVTSLMPGPTDTEFFERADLEAAKITASRDPADKVAEQGFEVMRGEQKVVAGSLLNKVQARAAGVIPDALKAKAHGKLTQKDGEH